MTQSKEIVTHYLSQVLNCSRGKFYRFFEKLYKRQNLIPQPEI